MNKIDLLIAKYCPNGVEYKAIEDVCDKVFAGGTPNTSRKDYYGGDIPWLRSGEIDFNEIYATEKTITELGYKSSSAKYIKENSVLLAMTGATVARSAVNKIRLTANQSVCALEVKNVINYKFLYYFIAHNYEKIKNMAQGALTSINLSIVKSLKVPLPPLPVQEEIVKILDAFSQTETELETELVIELESRRKQYEYYRNKLLSFKKDTINEEYVAFLPLFEICDFCNGKGHEKSIVEQGKYVVVNSRFISSSGKIKKYSNQQICPVYTNDILMVMSDLPNGKALAKCFLVDNDDKYTLNQRICRLKVKEKYGRSVVTKFLYYVLDRNAQLLKFDNGIDQTNLRKEDILNIVLPIPEPDEQKRIVEILDKFGSLINDVSEGLSMEIEARQKQYKYYRNKLLTFKPLESETD